MSNLIKNETVNLENETYDFNKAEAEDTVETADNTLDIPSAEEEAKTIIEDAKTHAEKIRDYAYKKAEIEYEEAKTAGFKAGYEAGNEVFQKENRKTVDELKRLVVDIDEQKERYIQYNDRKICNLIFKIAEKIINQRLDKNGEIFLNIYKKAVQDLVAKKWVKLTVSGYEYELATSNSEYLTQLVSGAETIDIQVLADAPRGTCIIETSEKIVDASVNKQLEGLHNTINNR